MLTIETTAQLSRAASGRSICAMNQRSKQAAKERPLTELLTHIERDLRTVARALNDRGHHGSALTMLGFAGLLKGALRDEVAQIDAEAMNMAS